MTARLDEISVRGLIVDCVIGVYRAERLAPQPIQVDMTVYLDTRAAAVDGIIAHTIDYARLCGNIRFLLERGRFQTMEAAADAILRLALAPSTPDAPQVRALVGMAALTKPNALTHHAVPSIRIVRESNEFQYDVTVASWGKIESMSAPQAKCRIVRSQLRPGESCELVTPERSVVHELVLGANLSIDGDRTRRGTAFEWPDGAARRYKNGSTIDQSWLSIELPLVMPISNREANRLGQSEKQGGSYYPEHDDAALHG